MRRDVDLPRAYAPVTGADDDYVADGQYGRWPVYETTTTITTTSSSNKKICKIYSIKIV